MVNEQFVMGLGIALVCLAGLLKERWLLANTRKGQRLVTWFGSRRALWVLRGLLALGAVFGALLAVDVVRPMRW